MAALPWARATAFRGHLPSGFRCATALLSSTALGPSYWDASAAVWSASRCPPLTRPRPTAGASSQGQGLVVHTLNETRCRCLGRSSAAKAGDIVMNPDLTFDR